MPDPRSDVRPDVQASGRPVVVICAGVFWNGPTMLDHHLARELAGYADVIYVDPPTSFLTRWRNPAAAAAAVGSWLEPVADGITVARPRVNPLMERRWGKPLALALTRLTMRRAVRALRPAGRRDVHAVVLPTLNPLFGVLGERYKVFYASDDLVAGAGLMGIADPAMRRAAVDLPQQADVVAAVSPVLVERLSASGAKPVLIPNGVDVDHFARALSTPVGAGSKAAQRRSVGFMGHLGDRIDVALLAAVADRGHRLLLVGPRQRTSSDAALDALLARPNVEWTGARDYSELPAVLAEADVWLLPYADSDFNRASFPLKLLEYLAAGRRVVATDLPAVRWLDTDLVATASGPQAFADAVDQAVAAPLEAAEAAGRSAFAGGHSWQERVRLLAEKIELTEVAVTARQGSA